MARQFATVEVDIAKLRDYCLNDGHPRGRHKARVFRSRLGMTAADAETLRQILLQAVEEREDELTAAEADEYGQRYVLDFRVRTGTESGKEKPRTAMIRS